MTNPNGMPVEKTAQQKVLAVYPDAGWVYAYGAIYNHSEYDRERLSGGTWWNDEDAAWADAASRLAPAEPAQLQEPAAESDDAKYAKAFRERHPAMYAEKVEVQGVVELPPLGEFTPEDRAVAAKRVCFTGEQAALAISHDHPERFAVIAIDCQQEIDRRERQLKSALATIRQLQQDYAELKHGYDLRVEDIEHEMDLKEAAQATIRQKDEEIAQLQAQVDQAFNEGVEAAAAIVEKCWPGRESTYARIREEKRAPHQTEEQNG